jgi:polyhydroxybutyrate depolymerase
MGHGIPECGVMRLRDPLTSVQAELNRPRWGMRRIAGLVAAFLVIFGATSLAGTSAGLAAVQSTRVTTYTVKVAGLVRSYEVITPVAALSAAAPVIVMLSGINASVSAEISRDDLVPYAGAGLAELVYPVAYGKSWNALGGCCGAAAAHKVNDIAFLKALVAKVDPRRARPVYVIGYSNGARLAYRIACTDPGLFDSYAMVKGGPTRDCVLRTPVTIAQVAALNDPEVPYQPGMKGREPTAATTLLRRLRVLDRCATGFSVAHPGDLTLTTWPAWTGCATGKRLAFAVYQTGGHSFPRPPLSNPAAAQVIWSFFTDTPLAPLPS